MSYNLPYVKLQIITPLPNGPNAPASKASPPLPPQLLPLSHLHGAKLLPHAKSKRPAMPGHATAATHANPQHAFHMQLIVSQSIVITAILPRALRKAAKRLARARHPALMPTDVSVLAGLSALSTAARGGIRARELRAAGLVRERSLSDVLTRLMIAGYITKGRRVKAELVLYSLTPKGADALAIVTSEIQREAGILSQALTAGVARSAPPSKRAARRRPGTTPTEPTPTPGPEAAQ